MSTRNIALLSVLAAASCLVACGEIEDTTTETSAQALVASDAPHVENEVVVKWKPGTTSAAKTRARQKVGGSSKETVHTPRMKAVGAGELEVVRISSASAVSAARDLAKAPEVEFAEPNYVYTRAAVSNDPYFSRGHMWGMRGYTAATPKEYGSGAAHAWARGNVGSDTVYVGLIDEGYDHDHEDLAANAGTNPGEIPANGIDDDGNGYVDDVHGWDFVNDDASVFDGMIDAHGTHTAGTIGAVGGNDKGVVGVAWKVKIINAKFLSPISGSNVNAIKALDYFTDLKVRHGLNIVATNNSWVGAGASRALRDAIERANAANILFVAAAGNQSVDNDVDPEYPASFDNANVISVGSISSDGNASSFSNWGARSVDLFAPGDHVISTVPQHAPRKGGGWRSGAYASYSGTSMAAPHVTGAAVLYAAAHPGATAREIKDAILGAARPTASLVGKCVTGARLDVSSF